VTAIVGIDNIRAVPRRPIIEGFAYDGTSAVVNIADRVVGFSNVVQTANQFSPDAWLVGAQPLLRRDAVEMLMTAHEQFAIHDGG